MKSAMRNHATVTVEIEHEQVGGDDFLPMLEIERVDDSIYKLITGNYHSGITNEIGREIIAARVYYRDLIYTPSRARLEQVAARFAALASEKNFEIFDTSSADAFLRSIKLGEWVETIVVLEPDAFFDDGNGLVTAGTTDPEIEEMAMEFLSDCDKQGIVISGGLGALVETIKAQRDHLAAE